MSTPKVKPITPDMDADTKAALTEAQAQIENGTFKVTSHTIWHAAQGKTFFKCRCYDPVPVLGEDGKQLVNAEGPVFKVAPPPIRYEAASEADAEAQYRAQFKVPAEIKVDVRPAPVNVPAMVQEQPVPANG